LYGVSRQLNEHRRSVTRRFVSTCYTLYFSRRDGTEVETRISSGVIPGRLPNDLPSTFGVVITMPNVPEALPEVTPS
jgi:hypothetical protein